MIDHDARSRSPIDSLGTIPHEPIRITTKQARKATEVIHSWAPDSADDILDMLGLPPRPGEA